MDSQSTYRPRTARPLCEPRVLLVVYEFRQRACRAPMEVDLVVDRDFNASFTLPGMASVYPRVRSQQAVAYESNLYPLR